MPSARRRWTHCLATLALAGCVDLARPDHRRARPVAAASQRAEAVSERRLHLTDDERRDAWTLLDRLGSRYGVAGRLRVLTRGEVTRAAETLLPSPIIDAHRGAHGWVFALESGAVFTSPTYLATPREIVPPSCAAVYHRATFQPSHGRLSFRGHDGSWWWSDGETSGRVELPELASVAWNGAQGAAIVGHGNLEVTSDGGVTWRNGMPDEAAGWVGGCADGLFVVTDRGERRLVGAEGAAVPTSHAAFDVGARPPHEPFGPLPPSIAVGAYALAASTSCRPQAAPERRPYRVQPKLVLSIPLTNGGESGGIRLPAGTRVTGEVVTEGHALGSHHAPVTDGPESHVNLTFRAMDEAGRFVLRVRGGAIADHPLAVARSGYIVSHEGGLGQFWNDEEYLWVGSDGTTTPLLARRSPFAWEASVTALSDGTTLLVGQGRLVLAPHPSASWRRAARPILTEAIHVGSEGQILARRADFFADDVVGVAEDDGAVGVVTNGRTTTLHPIGGGERALDWLLTTPTPRPCGAPVLHRSRLYLRNTFASVFVDFEDGAEYFPLQPELWAFEFDAAASVPDLCFRWGIAGARVIGRGSTVDFRKLWIDARDGRLTATLDTGTRYLSVPITFTTAPDASPPP